MSGSDRFCGYCLEVKVVEICVAHWGHIAIYFGGFRMLAGMATELPSGFAGRVPKRGLARSCIAPGVVPSETHICHGYWFVWEAKSAMAVGCFST